MDENLHTMRHGAAHILAAAMTELYPDVKLGVGPVIDSSFYYDMLLSDKISEEDFERIEKKMHEIISKAYEFKKEEMPIDKAIEFFQKRNQDFKVELLRDLKEKGTTKISKEEMQDVGEKPDTASLYWTGDFVDLCRGPHVDNSGKIGVFKLTKVAGAYWRGDETNPQLQRIYGVAFETEDELNEYLEMLEEAKKRDHRKLGSELDLFIFSDLVGSGLPLWTPKGTLLRDILDDFVWELRKAQGYQKVEIPHITKKDLYQKSGHWEKFQDELFKIKTREGHEFAMKPMNCPHHTQIYARKIHSYKELPQRYANTTMVYRDEQTGELHGLSRVRCITQDDAHVFCRFDQVKEEMMKVWEIIDAFYKAVGFKDLEVRLSFHDPEQMDKYLGESKTWQKAEKQLIELAEEKGVQAEVTKGEAAFYGPKIDFVTKDSLGREWQVATIQLDMNMPESFDLTCMNEKGEHERVVMIHCAIMGSLERFLSTFIEHAAGAFPMWMAPVQIRVVTVGQDFVGFAKEFAKKLEDAGLRVEIDDADEKVGKKIRNSASQKIPWTIVIGQKEVDGGDVKVNIFGQDKDLEIPQSEIIEKALSAAKRG